MTIGVANEKAKRKSGMKNRRADCSLPTNNVAAAAMVDMAPMDTHRELCVPVEEIGYNEPSWSA